MSDRLTSSGHSLCLKGPVIEIEGSTKPKSHKQAAFWSDEDTTALLEFLIEELPKAGDGNFKKSTWTAASSSFSTKFRITKGGGAKNAGACERRFQLMKKHYYAVLDLKDASGFTYSDKDGAGITLSQEDIWTKYLKSHPHARSFKMKGFIHFKLVKALIPKKGKGQFVFHPGTNVAGASGSHKTPPPTPTASMPPLNLEQLTAATNEITKASRQPPATTPQIPDMLSGTGDPNAFPTSAPSSYLLPFVTSKSTSSAVTSISCTKRKVSSLVTDSVASLPKQLCPLSAAAQAQQAGGAVMQEIAAVVKDFSRSMAPPDTLGTAIDLLQQHCKLTLIQRLDIGKYLALEKHKNQAILFNKFGEEERKEWLSHRLSEIVAAADRMGN